MDKIHTSERRAFRRCRKKWEYNYVRGLEPKATQPKLWLGTILHAGLAGFYSDTGAAAVAANGALEKAIAAEMQRVDYNKLDEEQRQLIKTDADLARGMLEHYMGEHTLDAIRVHRTEFYAEVPLNRATRIAVRLDGLCQDEDGEWWGLEHKTTSTIDQDAGYLELDEQATTYTWAMRELSHGVGYILPPSGKLVPMSSWAGTVPPIRGMLYNFLLKQVPHEPIRNKDGSLSVASANMTCKAEDYTNILDDRYGDAQDWPDKYHDFVAKLRAKKWFHRVKVFRSDDELDGFEERIWAEIKDMRYARNHARDQCYRNPTRDCLWDCPYFQLCKGELEGLDMAFFQDENFTTERQLEMEV